jgi:hypothetical protein
MTTMNARGGLSNVIDIVVSPTAAFERLRTTPVWGWAFLVATLLAIAGSLLAQPAFMHAFDQSLPAKLAASPSIASLPPEKQQAAIASALTISKTVARFLWILNPIALLATALVQAVIMLIANAITKSEGTFGKLYALSMTAAVVGTGIGSVVLGLICAIRGADAFDDPSAIATVIPGLATLVPGAHGALGAFLSLFNVFNLWATALLALGMIGVAKMPRTAAWATAIVMLVLGAAVSAISAARQG